MINYVFGKHSSKEAILNNKARNIYLQKGLKGTYIQEVKDLARKKHIKIQFMSKEQLDDISKKNNHQGIVVAVDEYKYIPFSNMLSNLQNKDTEKQVVLILDHLEDPHNFGSILRTADATNVDGIIIPKDRAVGVTPVVSKTSTGAIEYLDISKVTNLKIAIQKLKDQGFWIFGTDMNGTPMHHWNTQGKVALIIGNEGRGMSEGLKKEVDEMITIPMSGHVQSLNASVAASILMYQIYQNNL